MTPFDASRPRNFREGLHWCSKRRRVGVAATMAASNHQPKKGDLCKPIRSKQILQVPLSSLRIRKTTDFALTQSHLAQRYWLAAWRCLTSRAHSVPHRPDVLTSRG